MSTLDILDACDIVEASYAGFKASEIEEKIDIRGVQAYHLKSGILAIPGTNELSDWFDYNLKVYGDNEGYGYDVIAGDSGSMWHAGFLEHAQTVYTFAKGLRPKFIVGHSLGAASAQIVGTSLKIPTIAFASPGTLRGKPSNRLRGEGWVVNYCRSDDTVCYMPPRHRGFRVLGSQYWLTPEDANPGLDHNINQYRKIIKTKKVRERVPMQWPQ
ncbi:MAG: hypothetical protein N4A70_10930 [Pelagimonas sp.]|jgi:pimeloyl-ACP methyl ester carboxylesterase|nr:hypothetical protein [Pelagimonas sp.]